MQNTGLKKAMSSIKSKIIYLNIILTFKVEVDVVHDQNQDNA